MLNRIKRIIIILAMVCMYFCPSVLANDSTISYITINNKVYEDVELMITDGAEILVPFKQLADLFDIHYTADRVNKVINFTTYDGLNGVINNKGVFINDQITQKRIPIFLNQGIMDNVFNEAFIQASTAEKIMGIKLTTDYSSLTISAEVGRDVHVLHTSTNSINDDKSPKAHPAA